MILLLGVTVSALFLGRAPAIWAALLSFLSFDYFFTNPKHTLAVRDPSEWVALGVFLLMATLLGQFMALAVQREQWLKTEARAAALADADRLKTALLSMVSHDFRTPLTSIKATVSTLLREGKPLDPETVRGLFQDIETETDRLNRMVGNILDLSRLESDAWKPRREWIPISEIIGLSLSNFSDSENARIEVAVKGSADEIFADPVQLSQVLKNLVENALKYSPENSKVKLLVSTAPDTVTMEVIDEGRGIPAHDGAQEDIFKPFWRAQDLHQSSVPGVGIGLAVCRGLVEAHGGKLTAQRRDTKGSIFRMELPNGTNSSN